MHWTLTFLKNRRYNMAYEDVECPYCGQPQDINHDDGYSYKEGHIYEQECEFCGNKFAFNTQISYSHDAWAAPCLNDGEHKWQLYTTLPAIYGYMRCEYCGEERRLTDAECKQYNIQNYGVDKSE